MPRPFRGFLLCSIVLALGAHCGGSSGPSPQDIQSLQQAVFKGMMTAFSTGLAHLSPGAPPSMPRGGRFIPNAITVSGGCPAPPQGMTTTQCNIQFSGTLDGVCTGGSFSLSGSITGTLDLGGGVSYLSTSFTFSPVNCVMAGGWIINGDPYFSFSETDTSTAGNVSVSGTGPAGGWTGTLNGVPVTCLIQTPSSFNFANGHGSVGGSTVVCNGNSFSTPAQSF